MADVVDPETRSRMMSGIKGKNTRPELLVRKKLYAAGLRYRLHVKDLPGRPDIVLPKYRTVILVHGCFWHQHANCRLAAKPKSNVEFWASKLSSNIQRDAETTAKLVALGWQVIIVWECEAASSTRITEVIDAIKEPAIIN